MNSFRREGDYWSIVFEERTVRVRDLKGMRYLARLLAHPGREFHVLDLVAAEHGVAPVERGQTAGPSRSTLGDAVAVLLACIDATWSPWIDVTLTRQANAQ